MNPARVSTDGCSELSCPHHGPTNLAKLAELHRSCVLGTPNCNDWRFAGEPATARSHSHYMPLWGEYA